MAVSAILVFGFNIDAVSAGDDESVFVLFSLYYCSNPIVVPHGGASVETPSLLANSFDWRVAAGSILPD